MEKPPEEKSAAVSSMPCVLPTEVKLKFELVLERLSEMNVIAYKGQPEGNVGMKDDPSHALVDWEPETPPSPDAKRMEVPRAPSWAYALHKLLKH